MYLKNSVLIIINLIENKMYIVVRLVYATGHTKTPVIINKISLREWIK